MLTARFPTLTDVYPLTPMQQLFFSMDGVEVSPGFEQWEFLIEGPLDAGRLRDAWRQVVARHPILRTAFAEVGASRPHQIVLDRVEMPWHEEDWRDRDDRPAGRSSCASSSPPIIGRHSISENRR